MAGLYGVASWFCCGNAWGPCGTTGRGACDTCHSGSFQHAWPNASDACFAVTRPDACGEFLSRRTCGFTHFTTNLSLVRVGTHVQVLGAWIPDTNEIEIATVYA